MIYYQSISTKNVFFNLLENMFWFSEIGDFGVKSASQCATKKNLLASFSHTLFS